MSLSRIIVPIITACRQRSESLECVVACGTTTARNVQRALIDVVTGSVVKRSSKTRRATQESAVRVKARVCLGARQPACRTLVNICAVQLTRRGIHCRFVPRSAAQVRTDKVGARVVGRARWGDLGALVNVGALLRTRRRHCVAEIAADVATFNVETVLTDGASIQPQRALVDIGAAVRCVCGRSVPSGAAQKTANLQT